MRYAVNVPNFAEYADVRAAAALAAEAEAAGWDGFFVWDHIVFAKEQRLPVADPWILLAAVALATERLRLGPMVTPLARRRPWKVARETVTLDHLSGGRLILGVGLGTPAADEYGAFGEPTDPRVRAAMLDEALEVLTLLWSGETVSFHGEHFRLDEVAFRPTPVQRPRIPIFVAGAWPRPPPRRRAVRGDGRRRDPWRGPGGGPGGGRAAGRGGDDLVDGVAGAAPRRPRGDAGSRPPGPAAPLT